MKHAILITAHTNFNILQLMLNCMDSELFDFYILIDKKVKEKNNDIIKSFPKKSEVFFLPRIEINWGGYSQIKAMIKLMEESSSNHYDYYHFMQGSDFPIKNINEIASFFNNNKGLEFIEFKQMTNEPSRSKFYHLFVDNKYYRKSKKLQYLDNFFAILQRKAKIARNTNIAFRFGGTNSSLTHNCVEYILSQKRKIKKIFKYSKCADELFIQTIIYNSPFIQNVYKMIDGCSNSTRLIDWERGNGNSPHTFTSDDYEMLISADERLCFARKFDENVDMTVIYKLYEYLNKK